jgi:hypothetical protein
MSGMTSISSTVALIERSVEEKAWAIRAPMRAGNWLSREKSPKARMMVAASWRPFPGMSNGRTNQTVCAIQGIIDMLNSASFELEPTFQRRRRVSKVFKLSTSNLKTILQNAANPFLYKRNAVNVLVPEPSLNQFSNYQNVKSSPSEG